MRHSRSEEVAAQAAGAYSVANPPELSDKAFPVVQTYSADDVFDAAVLDVTAPSTRTVIVKVVWLLNSESSPPDVVYVPATAPLARTEIRWPSLVVVVYGWAFAQSPVYEPSELNRSTAPPPPVTVTEVPWKVWGSIPTVERQLPTMHGSALTCDALGVGVAAGAAADPQPVNWIAASTPATGVNVRHGRVIPRSRPPLRQ